MSITGDCRRLSGRVALITGATRGIGRAVAVRFAREGADLILVGRTQGALEEVDDEVRGLGAHASLVPADLRDPTVIDRLGAAIFERWARLDILIGNAGVLGTLTPVAHIDPKIWDEVLAINLTANWRLIRSVDPLLRASAAGRAVFVTSGVASGRAYWGGYAVAKAGLEALARTYAQEVAKTAVRVNLLNPGGTRTRMRAAAYPLENPASLKPADDQRLLDAFVNLSDPGCQSNGETINI
ncbi:MAG: SDR family NAD(P)-dependent oxidoreductase [Rhodospirillales bacterium]|nr:SDR family NAD(P)-dependent oxidoreductase [Rhodospirillales bacterium]